MRRAQSLNTQRARRKGAIFDRWGGKVFETTEFPGNWDGSSKGKPCN